MDVFSNLSRWIAALVLVFTSFVAGADTLPDAAKVSFQWDVKIPMRDGIHLSALLYTPRDSAEPKPCVFMITPYIAQGAHARGVYFASHGLPLLIVDSRGRGNSEGVFRPFI